MNNESDITAVSVLLRSSVTRRSRARSSQVTVRSRGTMGHPYMECDVVMKRRETHTHTIDMSPETQC